MAGALAKVALNQLCGLGALGALQPPNLGSVIQQVAQHFTSVMTFILTTMDSTIVITALLACVAVLLLGVMLRYTNVERRLGKDLIKGGMVLTVLAEFVFPLISRL